MYRCATSGLLAGLLLATTVQAQSLLIRDATLLDMAGNPPRENTRVLISGDRIQSIWSGAQRPPPIPAGTETIDASGLYLMPALMDSHVHYNWYMGELFLAHGITTVNDLGSRIHWQAAVQRGLNSGRLRGPRYLFCGRIGDESDTGYASAARRRFFGYVGGPGEARAAVTDIRANADCIRQALDTPAPLFQAITREAAQAGLAVIAHSYDALHSIAMGVNGIEHLEGVALATIRSKAGRDAVAAMQLEEGHKHPLLYQWMEEQYFDEVINALVENNVYLNPTLLHEWKGVINRTGQFENEEQRLLARPELQYIPMDEKLVSQGQYHWADRAMNDADSDEMVLVNNSYFIPARGLQAKLHQGYGHVHKFLQRFVAAGGKLYSGTDTAAASIPGISLHHELQLLVDAGVPELQALQSSTAWAAELLRVDDRLGTVETGKLADLLLLDGNPLEDIANTRRINTVIMAGRVVDTGYHADYRFPFPQYGPVSKHLYHQQPVISNIEPAYATEHTETALVISGRNFMPESVVRLAGEVITSRYISETEVAAILSADDTAYPGSYLIDVYTPAPGGGAAVPLEFIVDFMGEKSEGDE